MSNSRTITSIYECSEAPESLPDFIRWMQAKLEEIPEEYRQSAKIEVRKYDEEGCAEYVIRYTRPETEQEIKARDAEIEAMKRRREADERKQLERLKRKYEAQS